MDLRGFCSLKTGFWLWVVGCKTWMMLLELFRGDDDSDGSLEIHCF